MNSTISSTSGSFSPGNDDEDKRQRIMGKLSSGLPLVVQRHSRLHAEHLPRHLEAESEPDYFPDKELSYKSGYIESFGIMGAISGALFTICSRLLFPSSRLLELDLPTFVVTGAIFGCMLGTLLGCMFGLAANEMPPDEGV